MAKPKTKLYSDVYKKAEIAKIHIAKKALGLDDETYRTVIQREGGAGSSKDLTALGRAKVLEYFKSQGFVSASQHKGRPNNADIKPQLKKIEALLASAKKPWDYAASMAKHMYKKQKLEFCHADELQGIIAALQKHQDKQGA